MKIIQKSTKTEAVYTDREEFAWDLNEAKAIGYEIKDLGNDIMEIDCMDGSMLYLTGGRSELIVKNG